MNVVDVIVTKFSIVLHTDDCCGTTDIDDYCRYIPVTNILLPQIKMLTGVYTEHMEYLLVSR
jgi:hypothetical protein